jgi:hypothetical protein
MSLMDVQQVSSRRIVANRRNALKSTGPRTAEGKRRSSLNASGRGLCAESFREAMRSLNEDPLEFEQLHRDLIDSCQPANALEAKLVEDLATLWWKKGRAERAQAGVQIQQLERLEVERRREFHEINRPSSDQSREELAVVGLLHAKNCKGKFEDIVTFLDVLMAHIKRGENLEKAEDFLELMYGVQPSLRGSMILSHLRRLRQRPEQPDQGTPAPEGASPWGNAGAGGESESSLRSALMHLLREERKQVAGEYELFLREHREISPAARDACLAPSDARWTWILRLDNYLDRQIERKLRMLLRLQSLRVKSAARSRCAAGSAVPGQMREKKDTKNAKTKPLTH